MQETDACLNNPRKAEKGACFVRALDSKGYGAAGDTAFKC
jgi:hypothetical protein